MIEDCQPPRAKGPSADSEAFITAILYQHVYLGYIVNVHLVIGVFALCRSSGPPAIARTSLSDCGITSKI